MTGLEGVFAVQLSFKVWSLVVKSFTGSSHRSTDLVYCLQTSEMQMFRDACFLDFLQDALETHVIFSGLSKTIEDPSVPSEQ